MIKIRSVKRPPTTTQQPSNSRLLINHITLVNQIIKVHLRVQLILVFRVYDVFHIATKFSYLLIRVQVRPANLLAEYHLRRSSCVRRFPTNKYSYRIGGAAFGLPRGCSWWYVAISTSHLFARIYTCACTAHVRRVSQVKNIFFSTNRLLLGSLGRV
jgi:hypothetical protein